MSIRWDELPEYAPPPLPDLAVPKRAFIGADVALALGTVIVAIATSVGSPGAFDWIRWIVLAVWLVFLAAGWWLGDRMARSIHELKGQWPTRLRVARAWAAPALWVLFAELVILSLEPTEVVDVRPAIAAVGFWVSAWRPFASIRRTFLSLTRRNHDALVIVVGFLHIVSWSITWWLLHAVPSSGDGVAWASAIAVLATVPLATTLVGALSHAIAYRILAIQTREEHRYVRSLGLNPFHAGTYLSLVMAKQERERRRGVSEAVEAIRGGQAPTERTATSPSEGDPSTEHSDRRGQATEQGRTRRWCESIAAKLLWSPGSGNADDAELDASGSAGVSEASGIETSAATPDVTPTEFASPAAATKDRRTPEEEKKEAAAAEAAKAEEVAAAAEAAEVAAAEAAAAEANIQAVAAGADGSFESHEGEPTGTPSPRVTSIEAVRYAAIVSLLAAAAGLAWVTLNALALEEPIVSGRLSDIDVERMDRARDWTNAFLIVAVPLQAWWFVAARVWIRRAGRTLEVRRAVLLAGATSTIACVLAVARFAGAPAGLQAALLMVIGVGTWASIISASPIANWGGHGQLSVRLWATGLIVTTIVHALLGGMGPITPSSSVQAVAFVSVLLGLTLANTAIVAGVFTLQIEDDLRSSTRVALWYRNRLDEEMGSGRGNSAR